MVVTSPVAGVISNTLSAHAGMPKIVPVIVRMPRKYLYSRVPRASPCVVTSPVPGTTLTTRLLFEGTPQIDPSSATAAPSHLCSPGMHGPNSCRGRVCDVVPPAGTGGARHVRFRRGCRARLARRDRVRLEVFAPSHLESASSCSSGKHS